MNANTLICLVAPYQEEDRLVEDLRYWQTRYAAALLRHRGYRVRVVTGLRSYKRVVHAGRELWVLLLDGWTESEGVQAVIQYAEHFGVTRRYWHLEDLEDGVAFEGR